MDSKSRLRRPAWFTTLALVFAVSIWGLHYKLSLYQSSGAHAHGPAAKLLSQRERPVASTQLEAALNAGKPLVAINHSTVAHTLAAWAMATLAGVQSECWVLPESPEDLHGLAFATARPSTPRPPPITV